MLAVAHFLGLLLATFALAYVLPVGCSLAMADGLWPKFLPYVVDPRWALWAFMLNFAGPIIRRWSPRPAAPN